jgi:hypothetical protein
MKERRLSVVVVFAGGAMGIWEEKEEIIGEGG